MADVAGWSGTFAQFVLRFFRHLQDLTRLPSEGLGVAPSSMAALNTGKKKNQPSNEDDTIFCLILLIRSESSVTVRCLFCF